MKNCFEYAMSYIYRVPKTKHELTIQLLKKGYSEDQINDTVSILSKKGYIDDENYAQMYVNSELIKKGKPIYVIKGKLLQKGIDKIIIEKILSENIEQIEEGIIVKIKKDIDNYKKKGVDGFSIIQKLQMKGYNLKYIKKAIN